MNQKDRESAFTLMAMILVAIIAVLAAVAVMGRWLRSRPIPLQVVMLATHGPSRGMQVATLMRKSPGGINVDSGKPDGVGTVNTYI